jgi:hypothetical protein
METDPVSETLCPLRYRKDKSKNVAIPNVILQCSTKYELFLLIGKIRGEVPLYYTMKIYVGVEV